MHAIANRLIPFESFMSNLVSWRDVNGLQHHVGTAFGMAVRGDAVVVDGAETGGIRRDVDARGALARGGQSGIEQFHDEARLDGLVADFHRGLAPLARTVGPESDRKSVVEGKSVSVR